jgi:hypothetical protein
MPWGFAIGGAATLGSAIIGANASSDAANTQAAAAAQASQVEQNQFNTTQKNLAPWMQGGQQSLAQLLKLMGVGPGAGTPGYGQLTQPFVYSPNSPEAQFELQQGTSAIQNAATPGGSPIGGNTLKALTQFGQSLGTEDYQQQFNNFLTQNQYLANLFGTQSGAGQNAAAGIGAFGAQTAGQVGSNTIGAGNALAAGQIGTANSIAGGLNGVGNNLTAYLLSQNNQNPANNNFNPFTSYGGNQNYSYGP